MITLGTFGNIAPSSVGGVLHDGGKS